MTAFAADGKTLPDPLTPAECDLRDFAFMPMDIVRLFGSRFHAVASDAEWRAGVTLWLKSFHQVPAGSVPDDDVQLARLAEFGRDVASWKAVREVALHGWIKCSDGRLYHPVVAEKAAEAWSKKESYRVRSAKANEARWRREHDHPVNEPAQRTRKSPRNRSNDASSVAKQSEKSEHGQSLTDPIQEAPYKESLKPPRASQVTVTVTGTVIDNSCAESAQARAENPPDKSNLMARCLAVAGPGLADPARYGSLHTSAGRIAAWLRYGADLEIDVLPVIAHRTANARASPIRDWSYFDQPVADALARRRAPMPAGDPNAASQSLATSGQDHTAMAGQQPTHRNRRGSGSLTAAALRARARREADRAAGAAGLDG